MWGLFKRRYPNNYDAVTSDAWMSEVVLKAPKMFYAARTDDAFLVALITSPPWLPDDYEVYVTVVCADHGKVWQTLPLLRSSVEWARRRRAVSWHFQSDTLNDIGPLMRRLGACVQKPRYKIDLTP